MTYIPHTEKDIKEMLATLGIASIDELFKEIPEQLILKHFLSKIPNALCEMDVAKFLKDRLMKDKRGLCFIGAGAYEHYVPAAVWDLTNRGEFLTSYTPYQAEASQGTLQVIYEFQTSIARLMKLDVSNASMYDGASALAEAILMAVRANKHSKSKTVLIPKAISPAYKSTLKTILSLQKIKLIEVSFDLEKGGIDLNALNKYKDQDISALVIANPNFFGVLEEVDVLTDWAHENNALVVALVNPLAMAFLKPPGQWGKSGADIATGSGQPLGVFLSHGGPYFGFLCCKSEYIRQLPGRIVAKTSDLSGREGYTLTLQAREQHIRRAKATSNICTNQSLLATAATVYMSLLGASGMQKIASASHANAKELCEKLSSINGVEKVFSGSFFHEFVIKFKTKIDGLLEKLADVGIQGGVNLTSDYPELENSLLVCATETKSQSDLDFYADQLAAVLHGEGSKKRAKVSQDIDAKYLREDQVMPKELSELEVVRHFTRLSQKNFSVDTNFYPLGSCTMKYSPRIMQHLTALPEFLYAHPYALETHSQGFLECMFEMQEWLKEITGMKAVSLTPMAGAQGEFAGVAMIKAYHESRHDDARNEIIIPDAAHGTNPASATMAGYNVVEIPTLPEGDVDLSALKKVVGPKTAAIMLTNPSTLGVFERNIEKIANIVHEAGGLLYCDGANMNAILGKVLPGAMGFDVVHLNLHKTFGAPHGGGGPGAGPIAVGEKLAPFLPIPMVGKKDSNYVWLKEEDCPKTIGRLSAFYGNMGVILKAYIYLLLVGREGLPKIAEFATLNANYLMKILTEAGFSAPFEKRIAAHEFIISLKKEAKENGITAKDFAKRLLDYGFHAPTTYFPLLVPECFLIEPTETESKQNLDAFKEVMVTVRNEANKNPEIIRTAPHTMKIGRLDEVRAARELNVVCKE